MVAKPTSQKNPAAVALGRLGGIAAAASPRHNLKTRSPKQRKAFGRRAVLARWAKRALVHAEGTG